MRLFVALDLPMDIKKQVNKICFGLSSVKWVSFEQMHLTLRFIGDVDHRQFDTINAALQKVEFTPFEMSLKGVGQFPPKGAARVIWAGVEAPDELNKLAKRVNAAMDALGFEPEDRPFSAHITLARLKTPPSAEALRKFMMKNADFETPAFKMDKFVLFSSLLMPSGSVYKSEAEYR
jgi:RNA 2',3'-cyclic 3'-phosphodiesterase